MIDKETKASIDKFIKDMQEKSKKVHTSLGLSIASACRMVENTAKKEMTDTPVDPNKAYPRQKGKKVHYSSVEGAYPAVDTGMLRRSVTHNVEMEGSQTVGKVGTMLLYGKFLEHGTSKMAPRPWLGPSVNTNREKIHKIIGDAVAGREIIIENEEE